MHFVHVLAPCASTLAVVDQCLSVHLTLMHDINHCCLTGRALKALALCLFEFNSEDLAAFLKYKQATDPCKFGKVTKEQLVLMLPLSAFKRFVRRHYFDGAKQAANLQKWYKTYLEDHKVAVDVEGRHLVSGGPEGMKAFNECWDNQIKHALAQKMSGECTHTAATALVNLCLGQVLVCMH